MEGRLMKWTKKAIIKLAGAALAINIIACMGESFCVQATGNNSTTEQTKEYTIRYELNGGENDERNPESYQSGTGVNSFLEPYKFEHNFEGWYFDAALQNQAVSIGSDMIGNVILYAKWSRYDYDYEISYDTNYGINGEHNPSGYYEGVGVYALEEATRVGYTFEGWYLKDRNNPFSKELKSIGETASGDIALEAKFTPNVYEIHYEIGEGSFQEEPLRTYTFGIPVTELPVPVLEGKRLEGWYLDEGYTESFTGTTKDTLGELMVYAKWKDAVVESITLDATELALMEGETGEIAVVEILPEDAVEKKVTFESQDEAIVSVDENGNIQAMAPGTTTVVARAGEAKAICQVTVNPLPTPTSTVTPTPTPHIYQASFVLSNYKVKTTKTVVTKVKLEEGDGVKSYTSSNTKVAKVDKNGVVRGVKAGTATITLETLKGAKATCKVTVSKNIVKTKKITLTNVKNGKVTIKKKKTFKIKVKLSPTDSTQTLKFSTSKKSVATVTGKGVIKGKKKGNCIITVKSGSKSKKILLTVK